ncbi:hypothetical protein VNN41_05915 [Lactococcus garvieae]|uniref:hypothetical protein n=1 Tax=Lactococcus garvieae TaxID=1363 RepID=UPI0032559B03
MSKSTFGEFEKVIKENMRVEVLTQRINELNYNTYIEQTDSGVKLINNYEESNPEDTGEGVNEKVEMSISLARSKDDVEMYLTTCNITVTDEKEDDGLILRKLTLRVLYEIKIQGATSESTRDISDDVKVRLKEESIIQSANLVKELTEKDTAFPPIEIRKSKLEEDRSVE